MQPLTKQSHVYVPPPYLDREAEGNTTAHHQCIYLYHPIQSPPPPAYRSLSPELRLQIVKYLLSSADHPSTNLRGNKKSHEAPKELRKTVGAIFESIPTYRDHMKRASKYISIFFRLLLHGIFEHQQLFYYDVIESVLREAVAHFGTMEIELYNYPDLDSWNQRDWIKRHIYTEADQLLHLYRTPNSPILTNCVKEIHALCLKPTSPPRTGLQTTTAKESRNQTATQEHPPTLPISPSPYLHPDKNVISRSSRSDLSESRHRPLEPI
ncbi:hypothetical protein CC78DRAFT_575070 [Lojkania enalia]|uniref:Uncharacterized protein n=1 Tax=Lojkania enalia TaxID=147567 RepID=A0A9P4NAG7_9PLEO|nr:hypothetical protein CC78DRAFT_575070 [Didymosphaeria enalia]